MKCEKERLGREWLKFEYHVNKATIHLGNTILKTGNNSKLVLGTKDEAGADLDFDQMPNLVKIKKAAQGCTDNSTRP